MSKIHTAARQPNRKTSRSTPSPRAIAQVDGYVTAKITHMYSGHAQCADPICANCSPMTVTSKIKPVQSSPNIWRTYFLALSADSRIILKFSKGFLSPFDRAIILPHDRSVAGINEERSISALRCPLFFAVCFLFETLVQADFFHTMLYLIQFDQTPSTPLQANCRPSPLNSSANRLAKHLLEVSEDAGIGPSRIVRAVSSEKLVRIPAIRLVPTVSSLCVIAFWASVPDLPWCIASLHRRPCRPLAVGGGATSPTMAPPRVASASAPPSVACPVAEHHHRYLLQRRRWPRIQISTEPRAYWASCRFCLQILQFVAQGESWAMIFMAFKFALIVFLWSVLATSEDQRADGKFRTREESACSIELIKWRWQSKNFRTIFFLIFAFKFWPLTNFVYKDVTNIILNSPLLRRTPFFPLLQRN